MDDERPGTLREALRDVEPRDFPLKAAWREVIRALRARRRDTGQAGVLSSLGAVERALGSTLLSPDATRVARIKVLLRGLARGEGGAAEAASEIDALVSALVPQVVREPVVVEVRGWPDDLPEALRGRLLGRDPATLGAVPPAQAAALVWALDGSVLAGRTLSVRVQLPPDQVLPAVSRTTKARLAPRRRPRPWLPEVDEDGRLGLTPKGIAERQAAWLGARRVVDAFCGCGGNSVAFARAGAQVLAVERDPGRLMMAQRNARALGVAGRVRFQGGPAQRVVPALWSDWSDALLFLDPPWPGSGARPTTYAQLIPQGLRAMVEAAPWVAIKAPRAFDPATLPARPGGWRVRYELGEGDASRVVKMLTITGGKKGG